MGLDNAPGRPTAERGGAMVDGQWPPRGRPALEVFTAPAAPIEAAAPAGESP